MYARYIPPKKSDVTTKPFDSASKKTSKKRKRQLEHDGPEAEGSGSTSITVTSKDAGGLARRPARPEPTRTAEVSNPASSLQTDQEPRDGTETRDATKERRSTKKERKKGSKRHADQTKKVKRKRRTSVDIEEELPGTTEARAEGPETAETAETAEAVDTDHKHQGILSKYRRSTGVARKDPDAGEAQPSPPAEARHDGDDNVQELAGLTALPQPSPPPTTKAQPVHPFLPSWLEEPIRVLSSDKQALGDYRLAPKLLSSLEGKGFREALPIQAAVLPLLLPGPEQHDGDICISAATGSGKTLAYVIPLVQSLRGRAAIQLRGVIVVPTRELVAQAREVCEICCVGSDLRIQSAVGSRPFKVEQEDLIEKVPEYDAALAADHRTEGQAAPRDTEYDPATDDLNVEALHGGVVGIQGHRVTYQLRADVLVCTPGRLVDHIRHTRGFSLDRLEWLVVDEADKLLDQSFQGWLDVVGSSLQREQPHAELSMDQRVGRAIDWWQRPRFVRKVILSATMTKDVGRLNALKLKRPRLVVVDSGSRPELSSDADPAEPEPTEDRGEPAPADSYGLPATLDEKVVPVGDGGKKPLYLLRLLQTKLFSHSERAVSASASSPESAHVDADMIDAASSGSGTTSDASMSDAASEGSSESETSVDGPPIKQRSVQPSQHCRPRASNRPTKDGVLIFTKSNESALRLTRLLALLHPPYANRMRTLTSTQASAERRRTLRSFTSGTISIVVASNLVSRGMDISALAHVVNYDVPASVRDYVHRVGRTARAGKAGVAWTLVSHKEAGWFWHSIARGVELKRAPDKKVVRCKVELGPFFEPDGKKAYEDALEKLGEEVRTERR